MTDPHDPGLADALGPIALAPAADRRIRARIGVEVERRRAMALEGALHGGFALAAVVWAFLVVLPR